MEIQRPAEGERPYANVLLYGPPKTGKTAGAMTAPGVVLHVNADKVNRLRFGLSRDVEKRVIPVRFEGRVTMREIEAGAYAQPRLWDTVVLDPYGNAYDRLLLEESNNARRPTLDQRGNVHTDLIRFCEFMVEAPVNFIIVAHQFQEKDDESGVVNSVAYTGSKSSSATYSQKLAGMVDIVAYSGVLDVEGEGRKYAAQIAPTPGRAVGDGFNVLDDGTGYREMNLTEWFTLAGCHLGGVGSEAPQAARAVTNGKQTTKQEASK